MNSAQNLEQLKKVLGDTHNIEEILDEEVQTQTRKLREYNCELLKEIAELKIKEAQASHMALFPQENPNPVFRVSSEGRILYANSASQFALDTWETGVGKILPELFFNKISQAFGQQKPLEVECPVSDQYYSFMVCNVKGKDYANIYAREVTQKHRAEEALLYSKAEAEKANRAKSEFLSKMSHELRTPMNAVLGFSQILELNSEKNLTPLQQENISHILKAGNHLLDLINEVLDLAKVESGNAALNLQPVNVVSLIEEMEGIFQPIAQEYDIRLSMILDPSLNLFAYADKLRLKQILLNLVSNAIKYNHKSGSVTVACKAINSKFIQLDCIDTGPGISPEDQSKLFEPFCRLGQENSEVEGTGIGLTVTKELVELMGGSIGLRSQMGEGSHFYVQLPIAENTDMS
jgi:C4-dicarboxylate-specific signal transduction histidine kinase